MLSLVVCLLARQQVIRGNRAKTGGGMSAEGGALQMIASTIVVRTCGV